MLDEEVSFTENGQKRTVSRRHVILTQIVNKAALGDLRFQALLLQYATATNLTVRRRDGLPKNAEELIRKARAKKRPRVSQVRPGGQSVSQTANKNPAERGF